MQALDFLASNCCSRLSVCLMPPSVNLQQIKHIRLLCDAYLTGIKAVMQLRLWIKLQEGNLACKIGGWQIIATKHCQTAPCGT